MMMMMMMGQRSLLRPDQLDSNGSYNMAQLIIDGYSGDYLDDGYLMGLVLTDGYDGGSETVRIDAHDGAINQIGTGQVTFNGDVQANQNITIEGDLTVKGTTTSIETDQMIVSDPITVINASGTEALGDWSGFSARDQDGYNRIGWVFNDSTTGPDDGYWGLTPHGEYDADPDAVPTRALAYLGEGDAYGDLSSTEDGDSGADKIGVTTIPGIDGNTVQEALEDLASGGSDITGTASPTFTLNTDGQASQDEDICLIYQGGDGTSLMEGYLCLITDSVNGTRLQYTQFDDGAQYDRDFHLGPLNDTSNVDACLYLNAGDGTDAYSASICLDGDNDKLQITSSETEFTGDATFNEDVTVDGTLTTNGPTILGNDPTDCIIFNGRLCSDILPMVDDAYSIGSETNKFSDGYFTNLAADEFTINNNFIINGDTTIGNDSSDCLIVNASLCSDIIPSLDDAYSLGSDSNRFQDGYFGTLDVEDINISGDIVADGNVTIGNDSGDCLTVNASICSDLIPSTDGIYSIGSDANKFQDGYFDNVKIDDDLTNDGNTTLGSDSSDCLTVNASLCSDLIPSADDTYSLGSETNKFQDGYFGTITVDDIIVNDSITNDGDTTLGSDSDDCLTVNASLCSDLIPAVDDAYSLGSETNKFKDGYFNNLEVDDFTINDTFITNGDTVIGDSSADCLTVNASLCSDLIPSLNDAYSLGSDSNRFKDGYFSTLDVEDINVSGTITADGYVTLGDTADDHITINGTIYSDLNPEDCSHQLGDEDNRWYDGYFCMPSFSNFTPVGSDDSLIGVLKGIDAALTAPILSPERGVYEITNAEAQADELDSSRSADQGDTINVSSLSDADFRDKVWIYLNGQLLYNDPTPAADTGSVVNDVARETGTLNNLLFSGNIRNGAVVQIIDMR